MVKKIIKHFVETEISYNSRVKEEVIMQHLVDSLGLRLSDDNWSIKTFNVVKGERDYDVMEVFETMYKEFSEVLEPYIYDRGDVIKELSILFEKHKKHLERLENVN